MRTAIIAVTAALAVVAGIMYLNKPETQLQGASQPVVDAWTNWKKAQGKSYGSDAEEQYRFKVFASNYKTIGLLNQEQTTATFALNKFADLPREEFAKTYTGYKRPSLQVKNEVFLSTSDLADSVNWVTEGAVAPIKDQGQCGSCWAFSAVSAIESANYLQKSMTNVPTYSEQQVVDCDKADDNQGCNGGDMRTAMKWVETHSLQTESEYPYTARDGRCRSGEGVGTVSSYTCVPEGSPSQLKAAIAKQPVSVAIEADTATFQFYDSGVITSSRCGTDLDHGVTAVGYGSESGEGYFYVRNSWGMDWGLNGYVKIGDSSSNICGILSEAQYPQA